MSKKKMSEKELLRLELVEALRSLNQIVMDEEREDLEEESKDEGRLGEEDDRCAYCDKEMVVLEA